MGADVGFAQQKQQQHPYLTPLSSGVMKVKTRRTACGSPVKPRLQTLAQQHMCMRTCTCVAGLVSAGGCTCVGACVHAYACTHAPTHVHPLVLGSDGDIHIDPHNPPTCKQVGGLCGSMWISPSHSKDPRILLGTQEASLPVPSKILGVLLYYKC